MSHSVNQVFIHKLILNEMEKIASSLPAPHIQEVNYYVHNGPPLLSILYSLFRYVFSCLPYAHVSNSDIRHRILR